MFRYGGPIKEGIMSGIKEPRQRYQEAGKVFQEIAKTYAVPAESSVGLRSDEVPRGDVLQGAAELGIGNPYRKFDFKPYMKKTVTKPTDPMMLEDYKGDFSGLSSDFDQVQKVTLDDGSTVMVNVPAQDVKPSAQVQFMFDGDYQKFKKNKALEDLALEKEKDRIQKIKSGPMDTSSVPGVPDFVTGKGGVDEVIKNKGGAMELEEGPTKKEKVNSILESLGYDRAQKNALYDAMIKAGQRVSRGGLGAENLVSDVIAETSQSYDKPEKLREAANLMQTQQDLKLEQIKAGKSNQMEESVNYLMSESGGGKSRTEALDIVLKNPRSGGEAFYNAYKEIKDPKKAVDRAVEWSVSRGEYEKPVGRIDSKEYKTPEKFFKSGDWKGAGNYILKGTIYQIDAQGNATKIEQYYDSKKDSGWNIFNKEE